MTLGLLQLGMVSGAAAPPANGSLVTGALSGAVGYYSGLIGSISNFPEFDPPPFAALLWDGDDPTQVQVVSYLTAGILTIGGTDIDLSTGMAGLSDFPGARFLLATVATALPTGTSVTVPFNLDGGVMPPTYLGTLGVASIPASGFGYVEGGGGTITNFPTLASQPFTQLLWPSPSSTTINIITRAASGILYIGEDAFDLATLPSIGGGRRGGSKTLSAALGGTNPALRFALVNPTFPAAAVYSGTITVGDGSAVQPGAFGFYAFPGYPEYSFGSITAFPALSPQPFLGIIWTADQPTEITAISTYASGILQIGGTACDLSTAEDGGDGTFYGVFTLSTALPTTGGASVSFTLTNPA